MNNATPFVILISWNFIQRNKLYISHNLEHFHGSYWEQKVIIFVDVLLKKAAHVQPGYDTRKSLKTWCNNISPIIVNFLFIVISCTWSSMWHVVIIWLFGKIFEKITMLCFVLSLYDKNRFIFTIYFYITCFVLYSCNLCFLQLLEKKFFSPIMIK